MPASAPQTFSDREPLSLSVVRRRFASTFSPNPLIYWCDLLISSIVGWSAFLIAATAPTVSLLYVIATLVAIVALLRAAIFIHELSHMKRGTVPGFELAWNLLVGIPFLLPSLMYDSHGDHHRQATFATVHDPEYAPIAQWSRIRVAGFVVSTLVVPILLLLRWGVVGPLSFFLSPLRHFLIAHASSLAINHHYERPQPSPQEQLRWYTQETATALSAWTALLAIANGTPPLHWAYQWYIVGAGIACVNQVRTLAAHRYHNDGQQLTAVEQLLDSINLTNGYFLTVFAAPVGLRYHALHHFLPTVPYHSLGRLHRQLLTELAPDSAYHRTVEHGLLSAIQKLVRRSFTPPNVGALRTDRAGEEA